MKLSNHAAKDFGPGITAGLIAVFFWGTQLPVAKMAMGAQGFDGWFLTLMRYGIAALLLGLYWWFVARKRERHTPARGETLPLLAFGVVGVAFSPLLVFVGLSLSLPEQAAIIIALQPTMIVLAKWGLEARRPSNFTLVCTAIAFAGVICVVTKLQPLAQLTTQHLQGAALVFLGAACWVIYVIGCERFVHWPGVKLTVLPMIAGVAAMLVIVPIATLLGLAGVPSARAFGDFWPHVAYLAFLGVLLAMLLWTRSVKRIGAQNAMLLLNLIPVFAFGVRFAQGARFTPAELFGAALVIGALIANNLHARRKAVVLARVSDQAVAEEAPQKTLFAVSSLKKPP